MSRRKAQWRCECCGRASVLRACEDEAVECRRCALPDGGCGAQVTGCFPGRGPVPVKPPVEGQLSLLD